MAAAPRRLLIAAFMLLALQQAAVHAQETTNGQGKILWAMGQWLSGSPLAAPLAAMGWTDGGNPCNGWQGVSCNGEGYVTGIFLNGKSLAGSIPSDPGLWAGLTGLTNLDLANNQLSGSVPAAIKSAPLLTNVNLADNSKICGYLPTGLPATTEGTGVGSECAPPAPPSPPAAAPSPDPKPAAPAANTTTAPTASPAAPEAPAAVVATPVPAPTVISSAPICSCALRGFGSQDCTGALANVCRGAEPPAVCAFTSSVMNDTAAATAMGQYLADTCFKGQNMDTSICTCVQNLLGNDCAKARVSLCVKGDPLCLPIQDVVSESSSAGAPDAAQQVASAFDAQCTVAEPTQPGVKATMEFPDLSMGQYISKQFTQNVANALSSVTNVPTSSISTLDVRPFTGTARSTAAAAAPKRMLLQEVAATAGNGVQATYFLATDDPNGASQRLSAAANDGTLSARLAQYGINSQAGGLRVQNYLQPPASSTAGAFPLWALAPIIVGGLLLLALLCLSVWWCCLRSKSRGTKAAAYAPSSAKQQQQQSSFNKAAAAASGRSNKNSSSDVAVPRDMPPKASYDSYAGGYSPYSAGTAAPAAYKAPSSQTVVVYDTPPAGNNTMSRGAGVAAGAAAVGAMAAGTAAAVRRSPSRPESPTLSSRHGGSNRSPSRPESPTLSSRHASSNAAHLSTLQSLKARGVDYSEPIARSGSSGSAASSTLTPWEAAAAARTAAGSGFSSQPKAASLSPAASGVTGGSMRSAGAGAGAAGSAGMAAGSAGTAAAAAMGPRSGSLAPASSSELAAQGSGSTTGWKSNVRPSSARMPAAGAAAGGSSMLANPAGKSTQQAERAKFWAQFQETWQQVRQTQNVDNEPGSPSSGTNWTDITDARGFRHQ